MQTLYNVWHVPEARRNLISLGMPDGLACLQVQGPRWSLECHEESSSSDEVGVAERAARSTRESRHYDDDREVDFT